MKSPKLLGSRNNVFTGNDACSLNCIDVANKICGMSTPTPIPPSESRYSFHCELPDPDINYVKVGCL